MLATLLLVSASGLRCSSLKKLTNLPTQLKVYNDPMLLTALRRVQHKPDPLIILVSKKRNLRCDLKELPHLKFNARLTNLDVEQRPIWVDSSADFHSGRAERWCFDVRDQNGKELPLITRMGWDFGGIMAAEDLEFGDSWDRDVFLGSYCTINAPGEYSLRILHHNSELIAMSEHWENFLTWSSYPIRLQVDPVEVRITDDDRAETLQQIGKLPTEGPVKLLVPEYSADCHKFIAPDSPEGKLLTLGWVAVPELIKAANDPKLHSVRRARILSLLYSITWSNFPCVVPGVLGKPVYGPNDHYSLTEAEIAGSVEIDPAKQVEFAKRWQAWLDKQYIKIK